MRPSFALPGSYPRQIVNNPAQWRAAVYNAIRAGLGLPENGAIPTEAEIAREFKKYDPSGFVLVWGRQHYGNIAPALAQMTAVANNWMGGEPGAWMLGNLEVKARGYWFRPRSPRDFINTFAGGTGHADFWKGLALFATAVTAGATGAALNAGGGVLAQGTTAGQILTQTTVAQNSANLGAYAAAGQINSAISALGLNPTVTSVAPSPTSAVQSPAASPVPPATQTLSSAGAGTSQNLAADMAASLTTPANYGTSTLDIMAQGAQTGVSGASTSMTGIGASLASLSPVAPEMAAFASGATTASGAAISSGLTSQLDKLVNGAADVLATNAAASLANSLSDKKPIAAPAAPTDSGNAGGAAPSMLPVLITAAGVGVLILAKG